MRFETNPPLGRECCTCGETQTTAAETLNPHLQHDTVSEWLRSLPCCDQGCKEWEHVVAVVWYGSGGDGLSLVRRRSRGKIYWSWCKKILSRSRSAIYVATVVSGGITLPFRGKAVNTPFDCARFQLAAAFSRPCYHVLLNKSEAHVFASFYCTAIILLSRVFTFRILSALHRLCSLPRRSLLAAPARRHDHVRRILTIDYLASALLLSEMRSSHANTQRLC